MKRIAIALAVLFIGCTSINNWMDKHPASTLTVPSSNVAPWAEHIAEEHKIQQCDDAQVMLLAATMQDERLQQMIDNPKSDDPEKVNIVRQVLKAEQKGLWQLEEDIRYWLNTNCKSA